MQSQQGNKDWYRRNRDQYEKLTGIVKQTLINLIQEKKIDYLTVEGRLKSEDSFIGKMERKNYHDPQEDIHDMSGLRVIVYIESDAVRIGEAIENAFHVHPDKSPDKTVELGTDKVGYRSKHYVCELGSARSGLPEFSSLAGLCFEIQVRTILQHAWAELEHDRGYKFGGILPHSIARRLNLAAGLLEVADREFNALAQEIDGYGVQVSDRTKEGHLDIEINSLSLSEYLKEKIRTLPSGLRVKYNGDPSYVDMLVRELQAFGVSSLAQVEYLLSGSFLSAAMKADNRNELGLVRNALLYSDIEKYFANSWNNSWTAIEENDIDFLLCRYGKSVLLDCFERYDIRVN